MLWILILWIHPMTCSVSNLPQFHLHTQKMSLDCLDQQEMSDMRCITKYMWFHPEDLRRDVKFDIYELCIFWFLKLHTRYYRKNL